MISVSQTSLYPKKDILRFVKYYKYVILFNSEEIFLKDKINFDHFIGPCSGFKPFIISELYNKNKDYKITFFDFNQSQIFFYKKLLKWNGKDFKKFVQSYFSKNKDVLNKIKVNNLSNDYIDTKFNKIESLFGSSEKFQHAWNNFRKKDIDFIFINAISDYKKLVPLVKSCKTPYLWLSNIYNFEISNHRYGKDKCLDSLKKLLLLLYKKKMYIDLETELRSGVFSPKCALSQIFNVEN